MENVGSLINKSAKLGFLLMMLSRAYGQPTRMMAVVMNKWGVLRQYL